MAADLQAHDGASFLFREDLQRSTELLRALAHARQPVAITLPRGVEAAAVVADPQGDVLLAAGELDCRTRTSRVADDVVDALLEDQEDLSADICSEIEIARGVRSMEFKGDLTCG